MTPARCVDISVDEVAVGSATEEDWALTQRPLQTHIDAVLDNPASAEIYRRRTEEIAARMHSLRELRSALALTQETVGELMGMTQSEVSRLEHRTDILLSTFRRFVEATGGRLCLQAVYPDNQVFEFARGIFTEARERANTHRTDS